ncbi:hypothetical protein NLI96_g3464 [Meripilus lineatus]|uniref:Uncharacterized protein n=1 Tax=Meripilus lineatus TaxID=2056292 RepID=A0AAD5V705_9APHY|nr:hypothetical protein NLI96_g3464 [Physisporinus lineatus]
MSPTRLPAAAFPLALWLASPNLHPNSRQHVDGVPTLSRGVAEFLASLHHVLQSSVVATKEKWMWEFNVGEVSNDKQWTLLARQAPTITRGFTFRRNSDPDSRYMACTRQSLDFVHLVSIRLAALYAVDNANTGWDDFLLVIDTLRSQGALCMNLETLGLHFSSKWYSQDPLEQLSDEEKRKKCLSRVLSSTEPLRTHEHQYELSITLDGIPVDHLLYLLAKEEERESEELHSSKEEEGVEDEGAEVDEDDREKESAYN